MKLKWYISTLALIITLVGLNQEQTKVANQQIVLQFSDDEMTSDFAHDVALTKITKKLQDLGIADILITENDDNKLSIRYYSDIDAENVGEFISEDSGLTVTNGSLEHLPFDFPTDQLPENYSLIVSDIQQPSEGGLGLNGKLAFEIKQDFERFTNPVVLQFGISTTTNHTIG